MGIRRLGGLREERLETTDQTVRGERDHNRNSTLFVNTKSESVVVAHVLANRLSAAPADLPAKNNRLQHPVHRFRRLFLKFPENGVDHRSVYL